VWIERLVRASGVLGQVSRADEGGLAMITKTGWAVRLDPEVMRAAYEKAEEFGNEHDGRVGFDKFGEILEFAVQERASAVSAA
jgi:hypothetical protein